MLFSPQQDLRYGPIRPPLLSTNGTLVSATVSLSPEELFAGSRVTGRIASLLLRAYTSAHDRGD